MVKEQKFGYLGMIFISFLLLIILLSIYPQLNFNIEGIPQTYSNLIQNMLAIGILCCAMLPIYFYVKQKGEKT